MTATRQHADILVLGHSLEAALAAVLLVKRGAHVVWAGAPPTPSTKLGSLPVQRAPSVFASLANQPALARALDEVGLTAQVEKALVPVKLQLLAPAKRDELQARPIEILEDEEAPRFKPFAMGGWKKRRASLLATRPTKDDELVDLLDAVFADHELARRIGAAPKWLPGGTLTLVNLLWKRFAQLGGRAVAHGLDSEAAAFQHGWKGVQLELGSGEHLGGRVLLLGADDSEFERLPPSRLRKKLAPESTVSLWRLSMAVKSRGLPMALGPVALLPGDETLLLERRPGADGVEELAVFWRSESQPAEAKLKEIHARLLALLPFFDRHVVDTAAPTRVPFADAQPERPVRLAKRVLLARTPTLTLAGADGGALLAEGLSELAVRLAPRTEQLR